MPSERRARPGGLRMWDRDNDTAPQRWQGVALRGEEFESCPDAFFCTLCVCRRGPEQRLWSERQGQRQRQGQSKREIREWQGQRQGKGKRQRQGQGFPRAVQKPGPQQDSSQMAESLACNDLSLLVSEFFGALPSQTDMPAHLQFFRSPIARCNKLAESSTSATFVPTTGASPLRPCSRRSSLLLSSSCSFREFHEVAKPVLHGPGRSRSREDRLGGSRAWAHMCLKPGGSPASFLTSGPGKLVLHRSRSWGGRERSRRLDLSVSTSTHNTRQALCEDAAKEDSLWGECLTLMEAGACSSCLPVCYQWGIVDCTTADACLVCSRLSRHWWHKLLLFQRQPAPNFAKQAPRSAPRCLRPPPPPHSSPSFLRTQQLHTHPRHPLFFLFCQLL